MSWVSSRGAENSWNRGSSSSNRGSSSNSSSSSSSAVCDCSAPTLFFAPSLLHLLSLQHGCAMELYWYKDATAMLLLCYYICMLPKVFFSISFFFFFSEILSSFFVFLFQKEKMGKRKVCKRTAKTCVYIFLKREQKNHVKKSRLMIRYYYRRHSNFKTDLVKRERNTTTLTLFFRVVYFDGFWGL